MSLARATPTRVWERYVAIGDSFTEGMCDDDPTALVGDPAPHRYAGWADRLARALERSASAHGRPFAYANLAVRGRLLADVVGPQLDAALGLAPDLVSIVGGGNDLLRMRADVDDLAERLDGAVARVRATGADVLLATPVDPREAPLVSRTWGRAAAYTAAIWGVANRHGCHVIDQWTLAALRDWRLWAPDRIHLNAEGHRRVGLAALDALGHPSDLADWRTPLPPADPVTWRTARAADARWAREHVAPWVRRRMRGESSGDVLAGKRPQLAPLERAGPGDEEVDDG